MGTAITGTQMRTLKASVVTELPDKGVNNKIYYVPNGTTGDNKYDEYLWIKNAEHPNGYFEKVGQKDINLEPYALKDYVDKQDKSITDKLTNSYYKEQLFIDMWNSACGTYGKYNAETGFYELNGLTDITYEQALAIYRAISSETSNVYRPNVRTVLFSGCTGMTIGTWKRFENCYNLEVIKHSDHVNYGNTTESMFDGCTKLRSILGIVHINNITVYSYMFRRCVKLENFTFNGLNSNLTISDSPLITYNTLNYLISNALGNNVKTITVHPTTYAYLQGTTPPTEQVGGTTEQWQALVTAATNKKISFATTE